MGKRFLIDTNIAIYFLDGNLTPSVIVFLQPVINQEINISVITKIELLGWSFPNSNKFEIHNEFVSQSNIFPVDDEIVEKTIEIRRTYKIKLPDALIAATAIIFDMTLLSRNDKDFTQIPELKYMNPFTI